MKEVVPPGERSTDAGPGPRSPHPLREPTAATMEVVIGNLCAQVAAAEERGERWRVEVLARRKEAAAQQERIDILVRALRPFADIARGIHESWDDDRRAYTLRLDQLKVSDLRRAGALVATADAARTEQVSPPIREDKPHG